MAFMKPYYTNEDFFVGETASGESVVCPCDVYGTVERFAQECDVDPNLDTTDRVSGKWWTRLSAPGYLDATDWNGPFDTLEQARECIESTYDVDADTGDDLCAMTDTAAAVAEQEDA